MPSFAYDRPIEYFIVQSPTPAGPSIGTYRSQAIAESIVDTFGQRYHYVGAAPRGWDGEFDVNALRPGEFIVLPGLVYQREPDEAGRLETFWHSVIHS